MNKVPNFVHIWTRAHFTTRQCLLVCCLALIWKTIYDSSELLSFNTDNPRLRAGCVCSITLILCWKLCIHTMVTWSCKYLCLRLHFFLLVSKWTPNSIKVHLVTDLYFSPCNWQPFIDGTMYNLLSCSVLWRCPSGQMIYITISGLIQWISVCGYSSMMARLLL